MKTGEIEPVKRKSWKPDAQIHSERKELTSKSCALTRAHTHKHTLKKNFKEHGPARYSDAYLLIPALRKWRQKDQEFMGKFSVGQMRPSFKKHTENG